MLAVPDYLRRAQIDENRASYQWDEWNVRDYYLDIDEDQLQRLDRISDAGNLALAIGCGEWICHRLSALSEDRDPGLYLEAAWAAVVHPYYCDYIETNDDEWRGPIRGPLNMVITIINDGIHCGDENPVKAAHACWMYNLARHVLPRTEEFEKWFEACVGRLEECHPKVESDDIWEEGPPFGIPVPREALDPSLSYAPEDAPELLDRFLRTLDPAQNHFLAQAEVMLTGSGFVGTPYQYSPPD
jgi:hypothetical protein